MNTYDIYSSWCKTSFIFAQFEQTQHITGSLEGSWCFVYFKSPICHKYKLRRINLSGNSHVSLLSYSLCLHIHSQLKPENKFGFSSLVSSFHKRGVNEQKQTVPHHLSAECILCFATAGDTSAACASTIASTIAATSAVCATSIASTIAATGATTASDTAT